MGMPLLLCAMMYLGSVCHPSKGLREVKPGIAYNISDHATVAWPNKGEYMHTQLYIDGASSTRI
jgi:hypothetical protein